MFLHVLKEDAAALLTLGAAPSVLPISLAAVVAHLPGLPLAVTQAVSGQGALSAVAMPVCHGSTDTQPEGLRPLVGLQ